MHSIFIDTHIWLLQENRPLLNVLMLPDSARQGCKYSS